MEKKENAILVNVNDNKGQYPNKQLSQQIYSNLFFELGPKYNRSQQVKVAQKYYEENIVKEHQMSERRKNINELRYRIVNKMNNVYSKMNTSSVRISKNPVSIFNLHEKYNELVSMINSPQSKFFNTEVKRSYIKNKTSNKDNLESVSKQDKSFPCSLDIKYEDPSIHRKQPTIVLLKGNAKSRLKPLASSIRYSNKAIEFKEVRPNLPYLNEKMREGLKRYEMKDKLLALRKPQFKH